MRLKILTGLLLATIFAVERLCSFGEAPESGSPAAGPAVSLQFVGKDLGGASYDGAQLAGKPAVLWFWRTGAHLSGADPVGSRPSPRSTPGRSTWSGWAAWATQPTSGTTPARWKVPTHLIDEEGSATLRR